jgi:hypothetical protein
MKHEWRKKEKEYYGPKNEPTEVTVPNFKFISISGEGNPNSELFSEHLAALYAMAYGIRMSPKKGILTEGYFDYTVYPLEGVWDINEEAKKNYTGKLNKDDFVYDLMIRQPDFVTDELFEKILKQTFAKKKIDHLQKIKLVELKEGDCIQMLHVGSYDDEPESFQKMEAYAAKQGWTRTSKIHREIYLSDARKVALEKLKTVLRFNVHR